MTRIAAVLVSVALVAGACTGGSGSDTAAEREATASTTIATTTSTSTSTTTTIAPYQPGVAFTCPEPPAVPGPDPARPRHVVRISVDVAGRTVTGTVETSFTPDRATDQLVYRLWPNGPRPEAGGGRLDVGSVVVDGRARLATLAEGDDTRLDVALDQPAPAGRPLQIALDFTMRVPGPIDDRYAAGPDWMRLGSFLPSLEWQPGVGWNLEPPTSGFAESSVQPVADFRLEVTVPDGYEVLATGVEEAPGRFVAEAVRDVALTVGRFERARATFDAGRPVDVEVAVLRGVARSPQAYLDKIGRVLADMAGRYGPYPWPRYSVSITPDLRGGIEYPMHVLQGPETGGRTTTHEVAHMWFYGLVGNHQGLHPWLDEGLASWAEAVVEGTLATFVGRTIPAGGQGHLGEPMTYWESRAASYYRSVYVQGAQALAALGPVEVVDCVLRHHVATHAHAIATPADFVEIAAAFVPNAGDVLAGFGVQP